MDILQASRVELVDIDDLQPHEEVMEDHAEELEQDIRRNGLNYPLLVDADSKIVLDGHHRLHALKQIGVKKAPCFHVDYLVEVVVKGRDCDVSKIEVYAAANNEEPMPPRTTKHILPNELTIPAVNYIEPADDKYVR